MTFFLKHIIFNASSNVSLLDRYVECTSAVVQALVSFRKLYPTHRREELDSCIDKATDFIESTQLSDGSWSVSIHHSTAIDIPGETVGYRIKLYNII